MKLPEKYRFTGGVMGNGLTLGLTDGQNISGLKYYGNNYCFAPTGADGVGKPIGTSNPAVASTLAPNIIIGVTTDPAQSGIVLETDEMAKTFIAY